VLTSSSESAKSKMREDQQRGANLNIPGSFLSVGNHFEERPNLTGNDHHKAAKKLFNEWGKAQSTEFVG
jgi:hypothetical protein